MKKQMRYTIKKEKLTIATISGNKIELPNILGVILGKKIPRIVLRKAKPSNRHIAVLVCRIFFRSRSIRP